MIDASLLAGRHAGKSQHLLLFQARQRPHLARLYVLQEGRDPVFINDVDL